MNWTIYCCPIDEQIYIFCLSTVMRVFTKWLLPLRLNREKNSCWNSIEWANQWAIGHDHINGMQCARVKLIGEEEKTSIPCLLQWKRITNILIERTKSFSTKLLQFLRSSRFTVSTKRHNAIVDFIVFGKWRRANLQMYKFMAVKNNVGKRIFFFALSHFLSTYFNCCGWICCFGAQI